MKKTSFAPLRLVPALLLALAVQGAGATAPDDQALDRIAKRLADGDCAGAIEVLNDGLSKGYPEVQLLAGSMYENGTCVPRNWKKAVDFYAQADGGGLRVAGYRLAAGFAAPENGPDIAAALWWASRAWPSSGASACTVGGDAGDDPDRFVAVLRGWPQQRLAACNYVIGVITTLAGETYFPGRAIKYDVGALVRINFVPSVPRIDITTPEVLDGQTMRNRSSKALAGKFELALRAVADRALKRYPQPSGIDPAWQQPLSFQFYLE
jgi:TPR repeat protein